MYGKLILFIFIFMRITCSLPSAQAASIRIGLISEITGANAEAGSHSVNGAKLAVENINKNGGILGKQIELVIEDNQSTIPGTVAAFSKLIGNSDIPAIIGPIRSPQIQAILPMILKAEIPVMVGGSDPSLTQMNNSWVFRCRPNDALSSRVVANFGVTKLKLRKWAIVHSADQFGSGGQIALTDALRELGVAPVLVQEYSNNSKDFTPIVSAIEKSGADVIATYITYSQDIKAFATQLRQVGITAAWIGSASIVSDSAMKTAGQLLHGTYSFTDFNVDANAEAKAFATAYRAKYSVEPDVYSSWPYDALNIVAAAANIGKSVKGKEIRGAILGLRNWSGVEGSYTFDAKGDGLSGYNIIKNEIGKVKFVEHIDISDGVSRIANNVRDQQTQPAQATQQNSGARQFFIEGYELLRDGKAKMAIAKFEQGLKSDPNNAMALYYLAESYLAAGEYQKAEQRFQASIRVDPKSQTAEQAQKGLSAIAARKLAVKQEEEKELLEERQQDEERAADRLREQERWKERWKEALEPFQSSAQPTTDSSECERDGAGSRRPSYCPNQKSIDGSGQYRGPNKPKKY